MRRLLLLYFLLLLISAQLSPIYAQDAIGEVQLAIAPPSASPDISLSPVPTPFLSEPTASESATPTPTPYDNEATDDIGLKLNYTYKAPQNDKVTITFTKLPENPGTLRIQEVKISKEQQEELGAVSDIAYDITATMENGTFEYTLTLPTPTTESVEVKYSEDGESFITLGNVTAEQDLLTLTGLTHFTLFVVTTVSDFTSGTSSGTTVSDVGGGDGDVTTTLGAEAVDQSQLTGSTKEAFDNGQAAWLAQTFTAGAGGFLTRTRISLDRNNSNNTNGTVNLELRLTSSGVPTATVLATVSVAASTLNKNGQQDVDFLFSSPPTLQAGTVYALVLYRAGSGTTANYNWYRASAAGGNNPYTQGAGYTSADSGITWTLRNSGDGDHIFTTFVSSYPTTGTQTSDVLTTGSTATKFVRLAWTETLPVGSDITFEVRASDTSFVKTDVSPSWVSLGSANSPASLTGALPDAYQYFQWRATLSGTEVVTSALHDVTTTYLFRPTASPVGGDYFSDQTVTLSAEVGTTIRYTTDGTIPTASTGTVYTTPIVLGTDTALKAVAVDTDGNISSALSETYSIAPVISAESLGAIGSSSATITWTTDDPSTSRVIYDTVSHPILGSAPNYGYANSTVEDVSKVTAHSVTISGLTASTTYYYRTVSHGSPEAVGSEKSFATTATPSPSGGDGGGGGGGAVLGGATAPGCGDTPPGSAPTLLSATPGLNFVILTWLEAADPVSYYLVAYGTSPGSLQFGNPDIGGKGTTSYIISGLSGGTIYYFRVRGGNGCAPGDFSNELSATPFGITLAGPAAGFAPGVLGEATASAEVQKAPEKEEPAKEILGSKAEEATPSEKQGAFRFNMLLLLPIGIFFILFILWLFRRQKST